MTGCSKTISGFECELDRGAWWHDVYLTNKSGENLHEVKVTLTLTGEKGEPRSEERYYAQWSAGQTLKVSLSVENSPINVQKISLSGSCTEGRINSTWTSNNIRHRPRPESGNTN
jgi:hypothetical protein